MAKTPKPAPPPRADLRKALVVRVDCAGAGADAALDAALRRLGELDEGTAAGGLKAGAVSAARVLVVTRDELTTLGNSLKAEKQGRSDKYVHSGSAKEVVLAAALQRRILLESDGGQTIFILRDYPSTVAEAAELLQRADSAGRSEPALDAVVTVVSSGSEGGGVTWPAPRRPCLAFDFSPLAQDLMPPGFEDAAKGKPKAKDALAPRAQNVHLDIARAKRAAAAAAEQRAFEAPPAAQGVFSTTPSTTLSTTEKQGADAAPPLVRTLFSAARKEKGAWADLTFSTCPVDALSKEEDYAETVLRNLRSALETLAGAKCAFKHWVAGLEAVPVPVEGKGVAKATAEAAAVVRANLGDYTEMPPWASHAVRADYAALASSVEAAWHSPGLLLYCAVEAVCARAEAAEASTPASPPLDRLRQRSRGLQRLGGAGFDVSRADLHTKSTKSGFPPAGGAALSAVVTVDHADSLGLRLARAELLREAGGLRLTAKDEDAPAPEAVSALVLALERAAFRQMQQPRVVGRGALPPGGATLPPEKRGVDSTELLAFAGFSGADMTDFAQRSMFDSLLRGAFVAQGVDGAAPSVFGRNYKDLLASHVMMQLLSAEMAHEPVVLQHYHAATDELLLVLHQPTARGRIGQALWDPSLIFGSRPTFANWSHGRGSSAAAGLDALTPRSAAAHGSTVDIYADKLAVLATATTLLFPADHSVMKLRTMGPSAAWLTVRKDDVTFGLRAADGGRLAAARAQGDKVDLPKKGAVGFGADFVCDFGTARCVVHKLEKGEGVCLQTTDPSGLTLDVSTDGMVRMRRVELGGHGEVERVVLGKGTVVIRHKSGAKTLLFADGSSATQGKPGSDLVWRRLKLESIDAATQARISRPESGNGSLVRFHDGATLARHFDGTEMRCDAKREKVLVRAPGFAAVEISMAIDATARAHASGNAVAIKKGGARIRLRVSAHDGTRILATYDTSVTATIRSRLSLLRPDCAEVVCADDGSGQFRPAELWAGGALKVQGETSRSVYGAAPPAFKDETDCGAYDFDCKAGLLRTEDPEFNRFAAYLCGPRAGDVELELAGVAAGLRCEAVVNAPREARCLVVKRDGSGSELLRPADVARLRREAGYAGDSPYVGRAEVAEGGALDDTLNATLSATLASTGLGATGTPGKRRATMKADDSEDLASKQHVLVRRHDVGASNCVFAAAFGPLAHESDWATRPLPHAARDEADWPAEPAASAAPRVRVVRVVVEQKALSEDGRSLMRCAMLDSAAWVARRAAEMDRFSVADPRPAEAISAEAAVRKRLKRAYKLQRAAIRRKKNKERAAGDADSGGPMSFGFSVDSATAGDEDDAAAEAAAAEALLDVSDDEVEAERLAHLAKRKIEPEVKAAFMNQLGFELKPAFVAQTATAQTVTALLDVSQVRNALVQCLGRAVSEASVAKACAGNADLDAFATMVDVFRRDMHAVDERFQAACRRTYASAAVPAAAPSAAPRDLRATAPAAQGAFWKSRTANELMQGLPRDAAGPHLDDVSHQPAGAAGAGHAAVKAMRR